MHWSKLPPNDQSERQRGSLLTLAGNLLATVERRAEINWRSPRGH